MRWLFSLMHGRLRRKMMSTITWNIPRETLFALKGSTEEVGDMLRMASAVKLYEMGRISSGIAARLAGVPRVVFLAKLADYGVDTFQLSEEELQRQTRLA
jgi:predicted HTH domain antitoxin